MLANPVEVRTVEEPSIVEVEPNDRVHPQPIVLPVALSGRIDGPGDVDTFAFQARKEDPHLREAHNRRWIAVARANRARTKSRGKP